jgi:EAL domain-containing protein (putative c-di-GMP-specific phosphodiesterase class I)/GGDEF domain-containing protein
MEFSPKEQVDEILASRQLTPLFQPIISIQRGGTVYGYEALIRGPSDSPLHAPAVLFAAARVHGRLLELDQMCREVALAQFVELGLDGKLFLNVTPTVILEEHFQSGQTRRAAEKMGLSPDRVVIELTENTPIEDYTLMRQAVDHYRNMGFAIAIDDLGAGYAGFRHLAELRPELIKIDRYFVQDSYSDPVKRQLIHSICEIAHSVGSLVIAEGIETARELEVVRSLGVSYVQGYFIARPEARPSNLPRLEAVAPLSKRSSANHSFETVAHIVRNHPKVQPQELAANVVKLFQRSKGLNSIPVVDEGRPVGVVLRNDLLNLFASQYGPYLHGKKKILALMRAQPLVVGADTPLETISEMITGELHRAADEDFLVVDEKGAYLGVGTVIDLLKEITRLQVRSARYANPLTQLPGNVPINEQIDMLLLAEERFWLAYCDLDQFKPFNDAYGFVRGDEVIRNVARLLQDESDNSHDFVGHIGGDDFIVIFRSEDWEQRCQTILQQFELEAPIFYDTDARESGGLTVCDRSGNCCFQPFLSLSIGVTTAEPGKFKSHHDVANAATEVKKQAKRIPGNALYVDRRKTSEVEELLAPPPGTIKVSLPARD